MLAASSKKVFQHEKASGHTDAKVDSTNAAEVFIPCGSGSLGLSNANSYKVQMGIGRVGAYEHSKQQCRLYVPHYTFSPKAEAEYLSNRERTIDYLDIDYYSFSVEPGQQFNQLITNGASRMKRLVMIAYVRADKNGSNGIAPQSSPFASEPSTTSPFAIDNFNCKVGGINLYESNSMQYDYEYFLHEMNGQQGINANLTQGMVSSRISLQDWQNNYKYLVVNLDRKLPETEDVAQSLAVIGRLTSKLAVTFHCYIERYKSIVVDCESGARLG